MNAVKKTIWYLKCEGQQQKTLQSGSPVHFCHVVQALLKTVHLSCLWETGDAKYRQRAAARSLK